MDLTKLPLVTSSKIFSNRRNEKPQFDDNGLFSEVIFGPVRDYTCKCGITKIIDPKDGEYPRCSICKVRYAPSSLRAEQHAVIKLPFTIPSPHIVNMILRFNRRLKDSFYELREDVMFELEEKIKEFLDPNVVFQSSAKAQLQKIIQSNPSLLTKEYILVIPPDLRPISGNQDNYMIAEINHYYLKILEQIEAYQHELETGTVNENYHKNVVIKNYLELYQFILNMGVKEGDIRQRILAKRIDFSGRTVCTVDHTLKMDEVRIPYKILVKLWEPLILYYYDGSRFQTYQDIKQYLSTGYLSDDLKDTIDYIAEKVPVALNRQPTLHRGSMRAYWVKPWEENTIAVNPYMTSAFNLDFDGDSIKGLVTLKIKNNETGEESELTVDITDIRSEHTVRV